MAITPGVTCFAESNFLAWDLTCLWSNTEGTYLVHLGHMEASNTVNSYGASEGKPSESGIRLDAQAALDFVLARDDFQNVPVVRVIQPRFFVTSLNCLDITWAIDGRCCGNRPCQSESY